MISVDDIRQALTPIMDPELRRSVIDLNMIRDIEIEDNNVRFTLALTTLACPLADGIAEATHNAVAKLPGVAHVGIDVAEMPREDVAKLFARLQAESKPQQPSNGNTPGMPINFSLDPSQATQPESLARQLSPIKNVIGITSGKGGVGKSLTSAMLAVALQRKGYRVGVFDADITGASIPTLFGETGHLNSSPEGIIPRQTKMGIRLISTHFMLKNADDPVVWRGSKIAQLITDLWNGVIWGPLDYLLIDFPPGTSDAQLTVMMDLPINGLVMVTTPQDLANFIVRKAVKMSLDMHVPLLGVVENMSYFVCPDTGTKHEIFGPSHVDEVTKLANVSVVAHLPIDPAVAKLCDAGQIEDFEMPQLAEMVDALETALSEKNTPIAK